VSGSGRNGGAPGAGASIAVLDYRMSNLRSATKALELLGARVRIVTRGDALGSPDAVVLPGVGHFGEAMSRMRAAGLDDAARRAAGAGLPVLGICLGLQLLLDRSEESPGARGLGLVPGRVARLVTERKVPHIGWSRVAWAQNAALAPPTDDAHESIYYFVHSFACVLEEPSAVAGRADHGVEFVAALHRENVTGVQFHPEKSGDAGLGLLGRWLAAIPREPSGLGAPRAGASS